MRIAVVIAASVLMLGATASAQALSNSCAADATGIQSASVGGNVSILVYHRFGVVVSDSMTIRLSTFEWQLQYLNEHHYRVVPLRSVVAYLRGEGPAPSPCSVVITVDDGHESVFTDMLPTIQTFRVPVTVFVYPSAISNAPYAMTWRQLELLRDSGLVDFESHTYWHPNFAIEKRRLSQSAYGQFARMQLCKSKAVLRDRLNVDANLLAWPFGIYDDELADIARACGYEAGFTLERRRIIATDPVMALPRFLVTDSDVGSRFQAMLPPDASR
jgi:hypothetical protein